MAHFRSRLPASLYVAGPFAMGYTEFYNFLIPLYGLSLGMSAGQIGMLVGARSLLAVFLSIHVGVLMDRLGTRRVALFFVWTAMAMAPVFPLLPWFWPLDQRTDKLNRCARRSVIDGPLHIAGIAPVERDDFHAGT